MADQKFLEWLEAHLRSARDTESWLVEFNELIPKLDGPSTDQAENDAVLAFLEELQPRMGRIAEESDQLYEATGRAREWLFGRQDTE